MFKTFLNLESRNIPIISIIIYGLSIIWPLILSGFNVIRILQDFSHVLQYIIPSFMILTYVELNIGANKLLLFLSIVYIMRLLCFYLSYALKICNDKNSNCDPVNNRDPMNTFIMKDENGKDMKDENGKDIINYLSVDNLFYDGLLFPAIAFALVLIFMNNKNNIIKTLCIIFMISLYIFEIIFCYMLYSFK